MSISVFNGLSTKNDSDYFEARLRLQEIIYYAESRFRSILVDLNKNQKKTDIDRLSWTQKLLHRELVSLLLFCFYRYLLLTGIKTFVLNVIGTLTALNQPVVIPIILRTLAGSIALYEEDDLPFKMTPEFLALLDAGEFEKEVVNVFELSWWSGRKPRDLNTVEILKASTVELCLEHYKTQCETHAKHRIISNPGPGTGLTHDALQFHLAKITGKLPETGNPAEKATKIPIHMGTGAGARGDENMPECEYI